MAFGTMGDANTCSPTYFSHSQSNDPPLPLPVGGLELGQGLQHDLAKPGQMLVSSMQVIGSIICHGLSGRQSQSPSASALHSSSGPLAMPSYQPPSQHQHEPGSSGRSDTCTGPGTVTGPGTNKHKHKHRPFSTPAPSYSLASSDGTANNNSQPIRGRTRYCYLP